MAKAKHAWLPWLLIIGVAGSGAYFFISKVRAPRSVPASGILERCYSLREGETISYRFKGEDMVSFDIRRGGDGMFEPQLAPFDEGTFTAPSTDEYCLRFGNSLARAQQIEYSVKRESASE